MLKVVHLSTFHLYGGAGVAASRLNKALNKSGIDSMLMVGKLAEPEPGVLALDAGLSGRASFWGHFIGERLSFLPYEREASVRYAFSPARVGRDLAGNKAILEADIIHLHWINFGLLSIDSLQYLLKLGKPLVWTLHDMWPFTGGCHHSGDCDRYLENCGECRFLKAPRKDDLSYRRLLRKRRMWQSQSPLAPVACSQWLGVRAQNSSLFRALPVKNIPNPIDTGLFRPSGRRSSRIALGLPDDKDYLLFAAARVAAAGKGLSYLKEALKILVERKPEICQTLELLIVGKGDASEMEDIPLKVHCLGYISNEETMARVYSAASVYVTPSLEENLPNTVMEALACGTPVVGFRIGGIPEMVAHLENGYLAAYKSPESLAEGIMWVLQHNTGGKLSSAARRKVLREYDENAVAARYAELYDSLLR